jgi:hypothetical protein
MGTVPHPVGSPVAATAYAVHLVRIVDPRS